MGGLTRISMRTSVLQSSPALMLLLDRLHPGDSATPSSAGGECASAAALATIDTAAADCRPPGAAAVAAANALAWPCAPTGCATSGGAATAAAVAASSASGAAMLCCRLASTSSCSRLADRS